MKSEFIHSLKNNDLVGVTAIPKSDLHNHAANGGNFRYAGIHILNRPAHFESIKDLKYWADTNIKNLFPKIKRFEAAFVQASIDNISVLSMNFLREEINIADSVPGFISLITELKNKFAPNTIFLPGLAFSSDSNIDYENSFLDEILSFRYFSSIDICGIIEKAQPTKNFKRLFQKAKNAGLRLKAHVGEYGTADDVMEFVEELELDEVQHGIAASSSPQIMKWLANHKIQLNICPTSNILLGRVDNYKNHPIRILYDYNIPVTINTDDMLIFDQSVSQEYLNLYNCGLMKAYELENIRLTGLRAIDFYNKI